MMSDIQVGQKWRHKKTGGIYEVISTVAAIQISTPEFAEPAALLEDEDWIAYVRYGSSVNSGMLYFRMKEEFLDGRFEFLKDAE